MINFFSSRLFKFGLVGLIGMAIDFSITWLCKEKFKLNKYVSNSFGFCFAVTNNFIVNRYWTFESNAQPVTPQFFKFLLVSLSGLLINNVLLFLLVNKVKSNFYVLKLMVIGLVFFWNYFINFLYTFN
ncbi:MAG: GtrA family protein [Ferruginibacter sp.]